MDNLALLELRQSTNLPRRVVAQLLGIHEKTIERYEKGISCDKETYDKIYSALEGLKSGRLPLPPDPHDSETLVYIPLVAPRLAAGSGEVVHTEETTSYYAFRRDWLITKGRAEDLVLMNVTGYSMLPTILPEDMVMVNLARKEIEEDQLFAIGWFDELAVKRLRRAPTGAIEVVADNPTHPTRVVEHEGDGFRVVGRVVWLGRDL